LRLFEKHKNGSIFEITDAESTFAAKMVVEWREYQDLKDRPKPKTGFVPREEEDNDNSQ
jgi:hypothetical protein